jgi:hypothetical protein
MVTLFSPRAGSPFRNPQLSIDFRRGVYRLGAWSLGE